MGSYGMCNESLIYNMSMACLLDDCDGSEDYGDMCEEVDAGKCYPFDETLSILVACWCILNALVGFCTNLLTLTAIPLAMKGNRFGIANFSGGTTLFILNLAFADLLYCLISLPLYATAYLSGGWPLSQNLCIAFASFRDANAYAEWMTLGVIAFSRCAGLIWNDWASKYLTGTGGTVIIMLTWLWAYILMSFTFLGDNGTSGYNCISARCEIYQTHNGVFSPAKISVSMAFVIPWIVILASYVKIFLFVKKLSETSSLYCQIHKQEMGLTRAMLIVYICYLTCVGPLAVWNLLDTSTLNPNVGLGIYCVYWVQYSLNFFIYALQSLQFRKAYIDFLRRTLSKIRSISLISNDPVSTTYQNIIIFNIRLEHKMLRQARPNPGKEHTSCDITTLCSLCQMVDDLNTRHDD